MTGAADIMAEARRRGIVLTACSDRLAVDAPRDEYTPAFRDALIAHKAQVVELLRAEPTVPWPPRPAELPSWPIAWRERWGRLSAEFEDSGVPWQRAERQAFDQLRAEGAAAGDATTVPFVDGPEPPLNTFDSLTAIPRRSGGPSR